MRITKTGKPRDVFIGRRTKKALREYLRKREAIKPDSPLFTSREGERLTVSALRQIIRRRCKDAGLPEAGLHAFRRTFALESLRNGADVVSVSRMLGHKSLETTKLYLDQIRDDLKAAHSKSSPVDRLEMTRQNKILR